MGVVIRKKNGKEGKPNKPSMVYTASDHAASAESVIQFYEKLDHHEDDIPRLTDLLEDLHHWADKRGVDFGEALLAAQKRYQDHLQEEALFKSEMVQEAASG